MLAALAGCGGPGSCGKPGVYATARPGPPLRVPEDLAEPPKSDAFALPDPPPPSENPPCGYMPPKINQPRTASAPAAPAPSTPPSTTAEPVAPAPASTAEAAPAAEPSTAAPAGQGASAPVDDALASELRALVEDWASAWASGDFEGYLRHYARDFDPPGELTLEEWRTARQSRIEKRPTMQVEMETFTVTESAPDRVAVEFVQTSELEGVTSRLRKGLVLVREDGAWRIQKETVVDVLTAR
jgi:hypothetical protein